MNPRYSVRVTKDHLVFSACHFITYDGGKPEPLHGHNFRMEVEVDGPLNSDEYVVDFIQLLELAKAIAAGWDHKVLLPTQSEHYKIEDDGPNYLVRYQDTRWSFPRDGCILLPIGNTTVELIAKVAGEQLLRDFAARSIPAPPVLRVSVEENFGQWATAEWRREPESP